MTVVMRDSKGRAYDGWCMRMPDDWSGEIAAYTFTTTRQELWTDWLAYGDEMRLRKNRMRSAREKGFRPIKVLLVPVE